MTQAMQTVSTWRGDPPSLPRVLLALVKACVIAAFTALVALGFGLTHEVGALGLLAPVLTPLGAILAFLLAWPLALFAAQVRLSPAQLATAGLGFALAYVFLGHLLIGSVGYTLSWLLMPADWAANALDPETWRRGRNFWQPGIALLAGIPLGGWLGGLRMGQLLYRSERPRRSVR